MNTMSKFRTAMMVFFAIMLSARPVYAEDIEIYLIPGAENGGANILLLIDTSGATNRNFPGVPDPNAGDKTIDQMSYALQLVVEGLAGSSRVGVASQQSGSLDGGAINYPVKQINETTSPVAFSAVADNAADAQQGIIGGVVQPIDITSEKLQLPPRRIGTTEPQRLGLLFDSVKVPRYAKVEKATLSAATPDTNYGDFKLAMAYQQDSAPQLFSASSDLSDGFAESRTWSPLDTVIGSVQSGKFTADVTDLVQSAVAETFWCGNASLALMVDQTDLNSPPVIYSYRALGASGERLGAISLEIEWSATDVVSPPGTATGQDVLSCMGGLTLGLAGGGDDARESTTDPNNLKTDEDTLLLANVGSGPNSDRGDFVGGLRFVNIPFQAIVETDADPMTTAPSTVRKAELFYNVTARVGVDPAVVIKPMLGDTPAFMTAGSVRGTATGVATPADPVVLGLNSTDVTAQVDAILRGPGWPVDGGGSFGFRIERAPTGTSSVTIHAVEGGAASGAYLKLDMLSAKATDFAGVISRRDDLKRAVQKFSNASGGSNNMPGTSYLESALYMLGRKPVFDGGTGHIEAFTAADRSQYQTPIAGDFECGGNHIILVTHAEPRGDKPSSVMNALTGDGGCPTDSNSDGWTCMSNLAKFLKDAKRNGLNIPILTHTVAFAADADAEAGLKDVAMNGGGVDKTASNAQDLAATLSEIIDDLTTTNASMAAPGVAVNQLNRFRHLDQLYYALFRPQLKARWQGNLKRYRLNFETQRIVDENGNDAVDTTTGFFKDSANSWWGQLADGTDPNDGQNVDAGGVKKELELTIQAGGARKLLVSKSSPAAGGSQTATSAPLGVEPVQVVTSADVTAAELGMDPTASASEKQQRLDMLLKSWGDPLHSEPRLVNYGFTGTFEEAMLDDDKQDNTVFFTTNDGVLHAIEPKTGKELFAYTPGEELARTETRFQNLKLNAADPQRNTYGLDGGITVWRRTKTDGSGEPEHVYLFLSQRRGGNAYYAMNVSDRSKPRLMWKLQGGAAPFDKLGQTWSQPTLSQIALGGQRVPVLVFGGGYSPADHDTVGSVSAGDSVGNAIYIVNAFNGELIWSVSTAGETVSHADMKWALPSAPSVVDINFDGVIDYIYAADMGGQVFRIDLDTLNTGAADLAKRVVTLAKLGTSDAAGIANHRRFHAAPVVALSKREGGEPFLQVALGSGYRSHPLNMDTSDYIFMLDDEDALKDTSSTPITRADMVDVTTDLSPDPALFTGKRGWYIQLDNGEKVLSSGVVSNGVLFMSSYLPESAFINKCQRVVGSSRLYAMGLLDGAPALDLNNDGSIDRSTDLVLPGLPPSPQLLLDGTGDQVLLIGTQALSGGKVGGGKGVRKTRWFEVQTQTEADKELEDAMLGQ